MKATRIHFGVLLASIFIECSVWASSEELVSRVRSALTDVATAMPDGRRRMPEYLYEFGYKYKSNPYYLSLSAIVSNNLEAVCSNFNACATNELNRLLLLSTAWAFDGDYYLQCLSNDLELVDAGVLSKREFLWARRASRSVSLLGLVPKNYNRPGVSNLVLRMQQVIGETNYCQRILSGAAREDVINYMDSMSDPSNEQ